MEKEHELCFWCDLVNIPRTIKEYTPCERCARVLTKGIVLIEVQDIPMQVDQPTLVIPNNYPTGVWFVIKTTTASQIFNQKDFHKVVKDKIAFLDRGMVENLGLKPKEEHEETIQ